MYDFVIDIISGELVLTLFFVIYVILNSRYVPIVGCIISDGIELASPRKYKRVMHTVCYSVNGIKYGCKLIMIGNTKYSKGQFVLLDVAKKNHSKSRAELPIECLIIQAVAIILTWLLLIAFVCMY